MILAYVDPSVMSYTVQAIAGVVIALGVVIGVVWRKMKRGANKVLGRDENSGKEIEEEVKVRLISAFLLICSASAAVGEALSPQPLAESLWFFADFDRPTLLGGNSLGSELSPTGITDGKFGQGYRFHRAVANRLPPMASFLSPAKLAANFYVAKSGRLPQVVAPGRIAFAGGILMITNRPAEITYHYVRPSAAATWSFFVRGAKGTKLEARALLTPPTEAGLAEGAKKHGYKADNAVKEEHPTVKLTLDGSWQRVWAYAKADNRISAGRETFCAIRSDGPIELERFQYETTGYYPEINTFRPGLPLDGGDREGAQLFLMDDPQRLADFPLDSGGCSVWIRYDELNSNGVENAAIWGLNRSWQSNRGFTLQSLRTDAKDVLSVARPARRDLGWHHFAASWDAGRRIIWRDGVRIAEGPTKAVDLGDDRHWVFRAGGFGDGNATSEAVLDELAIFKRPLADDEVRRLYAARTGLRDGTAALTATPVIFKVFARNQRDAALRRRIHAANAGNYRLSGSVGGLSLAATTVTLKAGWNELAVGFDPAQFRPGKYPYQYRLVAADGRTALADEGTLEIRGQVARDGFMIHSWGGNHSASSAFLRQLGVTARNVSSTSIPAVRRAVEDGLFANVRYENSKRWINRNFTASEVAAAAATDLAWLRGCHWWTTTLVNSEVYGGGSLTAARKVEGFDALAARELGFSTDWPVKFAPDAVDWKKAGVEPPRGVLDREPEPLAAFRWYLDRGMPSIRVTAATVPGIHRLSPDNVVWSEPTYAVGLAQGVDMIAGWTYQYETSRVLAELYAQYAVARAAKRPFMPTLEPGYHPGVNGKHPYAKGPDGQPLKVELTPSVNELEAKAMLAIAAVPANNLSLFNDEAWEHGSRDARSYCQSPTNRVTCIAEPESAERFGAFVRERFLPAALLLRNLPNECAPVALAPSTTVSLGGGFWWGHTHFLTAAKLALVRTGVPFDILEDVEQTGEKLSAYAAVFAPMRNLALASERAALAAAHRHGTEIAVDKYAQLDLPGLTVLSNFVYQGSLVNPPGGLEKMGEPLAAWAHSRRAEWRARMTAWSEEDGDGVYTFTKLCGRAKYVIVVNDTRAAERGIFAAFKTNDWYRPMGASRVVHTHFKNVADGTLRVFNAQPGAAVEAKVKGGTVASTLGPGEARIFALLPQVVGKLDLEVEGKPQRGGHVTLRFHLRDREGLAMAGRQLVELTVTRPDGSRDDASGWMVLNDGEGETVLRFAHDDALGTAAASWRISARELVTGSAIDNVLSATGLINCVQFTKP